MTKKKIFSYYTVEYVDAEKYGEGYADREATKYVKVLRKLLKPFRVVSIKYFIEGVHESWNIAIDVRTLKKISESVLKRTGLEKE